MRVLVLNAGSSSLKASVLETTGLQTLARTEVFLGTDATRSEARRRSVQDVLQALRQTVDLESVGGVGHRVVHGGTRFRTAVRIDAEVLGGIEALTEFAPLHNQVAADTIRAAQSAFPAVPQVAAFDTAFHAGLPPAGFVYPGILIYVLRTGRVKREELEDQLDHQSGLVGVSGRSAGMRELEQAATGGDKRARLAIEIFIRKAAAGIAAAGTALPQLDAVVFT